MKSNLNRCKANRNSSLRRARFLPWIEGARNKRWREMFRSRLRAEWSVMIPCAEQPMSGTILLDIVFLAPNIKISRGWSSALTVLQTGRPRPRQLRNLTLMRGSRRAKPISFIATTLPASTVLITLQNTCRLQSATTPMISSRGAIEKRFGPPPRKSSSRARILSLSPRPSQLQRLIRFSGPQTLFRRATRVARVMRGNNVHQRRKLQQVHQTIGFPGLQTRKLHTREETSWQSKLLFTVRRGRPAMT